MKHDSQGSRRALMIALLAVVAIGLGFLGDFIITCIEKNAYPREYAEYVETYSQKYGVPESLVFAVIHTESSFDSGAVSPAGAVGLMQMTPDTFKWLTDEILFDHLESGMLYDPETNIKYGTYLLSRYYDRYGDWELVFAAYNGGPGNLDKWLEDPEYSDGEGGLKKIPFRETRNYVKKVADAWDMYERLYGEEYEAETAQ
ncbi:MAG: lytic transglycosylase domain-containing protein [Clostridia bacterium]|nr:lytic transglycosylase domain-containing protein [Clostridia bacterium]